MSNDTKLAELRSRTDQDLLFLIERELDRGIALANVAASRESPLHIQAEKTYRKIVTLMLKAPGVIQRERVHLQARLKELRLLLDDAPTVAKMVRDCAALASGS